MKQLSALLTDFYQFSMAYGYWQLGMHEQEAVFHVFFRRQSSFSQYTIAAGLNSVISFLKDFHFSETEIDYLRTLKNNANKSYFSEAFLSYLAQLRFTGDIDAMPEGTVAFPNEPLLRIKAPLLLCQLLETPLLNFINFPSVVATMAAQMRSIVGDDQLFEFGLRRAQGPDGGLTASRSAYIAGFDATSNVLAGKQFDIPIVGTMAHSWVMAFENELVAFEAYARSMPDDVILLVDTYNTKMGVDHAIMVGKTLRKHGGTLHGIRLDSGDLASLSAMTRDKLDQAGFSDTKIVVSGDLNIHTLRVLKEKKASIDGWGVGTHLSTAYEQPALDMVYKLGAIQRNRDWAYKLKCTDTQLKTSDPGILQVRRYTQISAWLGDVIYHVDFGIKTIPNETVADGHDLLAPIFRQGKLVYQQPKISDIRDYCMGQVKQFQSLPDTDYSVQRDKQLLALKEQIMETNMHE